MGKNPAFQFYPGDYFREPGLQCVGLNVRGAWSELLYVMHDCVPQGRKETNLEGFSRLWRTTFEEAAFIITKLEEEEVADVKYFNDDVQRIVHDLADYYLGLTQNRPTLSPECPLPVTITNRRMFRAWIIKENDRLKKQRKRMSFHDPSFVQKKSPSISSSSSSSSSSIQKKYIKKSISKLPDEEWLKELQKKECYSHLNLTDSLQKCIVFFETKGVTVSRQRFLNWINNPKYNSKPLSLKSQGPPPKLASTICNFCNKEILVKDMEEHLKRCPE